MSTENEQLQPTAAATGPRALDDAVAPIIDESASNGQAQPPAVPIKRPIVAAIGASAGGVEAIRTFFQALPADLGIAFVVVMHLAPEYPSELAAILGTYTNMPATQVTDAVHLEANQIYVIPPNRSLLVTDSTLATLPFTEPRGQRAPIDLFFRSLAEAHGDGFALIFSGSGSDGSVGLKSVKENGGLVLVQEPTEATFDGMPRSAIATGLADLVLPVRQLAARMADLVHSKTQLQAVLASTDTEALAEDDELTLRRILTQVQARTGSDFSQYKRLTLLRRLGRRMQVNRTAHLRDYLALLRESNTEVQVLFTELLISVTTFFRDPTAFEALRTQVIAPLLAAKSPDLPLRIWVPGCATGEEAYSLAMLLLEEASQRGLRPYFQIFATDLAEEALTTAREGRYSAAIQADVSPERLLRFFTKEGEHYRINKELRDTILFATHNLLKDPPFSRLDLISCRNLLIYLDRSLQEQVFGIFYYALRHDAGRAGYLFLGTSETVTEELFRTLDKRQRIFQLRERERSGLPTLPDLLLTTPSLRLPVTQAPRVPPPQTAATFHRQLLEDLAPPSILVDGAHNVLHLSETAGRYLQHPGGAPTRNLLELVRPELQFELRLALQRALEQDARSLTPFISVHFNGNKHGVMLLVQPQRHLIEQERLALVIFLEGPPDALPAPTTSTTPLALPPDYARQQQLQTELRQTQRRLETMREEYEAANEELRAANEELQSINEEYRSTAEELETSKEELQSINEELYTVNAELKSKLDEISHAHSDLQNFMAATEGGTLFLDRELRINRFTRPVADLINVKTSDRGRPITDFTHRLNYETLERDARYVLESLATVEHQVESSDQRAFIVRLRPYRTVDNLIDGVVITFVDITERRNAEEAAAQARVYAESIVDTVRDALIVLTPDLRVQTASTAFYRHFQMQPAQTEGRHLYELGNGQWDIPELRTLLEEILPANHYFNDYEVTQTFEQLGRRTMLLNARQLDNVQRILLAIEDITARKVAAETLHASERRYRALARATTVLLYRLSADGTQLLEVDAGTTQPQAKATQPVADWLKEYVHPEDWAATYTTLTKTIANQQPCEIEHRVRQAPQGWQLVCTRIVPVHDETGTIIEWIGAATAATEQR